MRILLAGLALAAAALLVGAGTAPAQQTTGCAGRIRPDLGFTGMNFNQGTTYVTSDLTLFGTEPVLTGASGGAIEEGDVLVAVDGVLITTRDGAERFAAIRPGVPVHLMVRRGNRSLDVRIVPGSQCVPDEPPARTQPRTVTMSGDISIQPSPDRPGRPVMLGIGLSCSYCALQLAPDGTAIWQISSPPRVEKVTPGSAAARAGVRAGDQIVSVDGVAITTPEGGRRFGTMTPGKPVRIGVLRHGKRLEVTVVPGTE